MNKSFLSVYDEPGSDERLTCQILGDICTLMSGSVSHHHAPISYVGAVLLPAIYLKQVKVFYNEDGLPVGYAIWALLANDVQSRVMSSGHFTLHESEWNEGDNLWMLDFAAPKGGLKYILINLRDTVFLQRKNIRYFRNKNKCRIIKEVTRSSSLTFFNEQFSSH